MQPKLTFDTEVDSFYLQLSEEPIYNTKKITSNIKIDVNEAGFIIGIESLSFGAEIPFAMFKSEYSMSNTQIDEIKLAIKPIYRS